MGFEIIRDTLAFLLILGAAAGVEAQTAAEPPNPLTQIKGLKCQFPSATSASWKEGAPVAQTKTQDMRFELSNIDVQDATAEFMGTAGPRVCHGSPVGMEPLLRRERRRAAERDDRVLPGGLAQEAQGGAFPPRIPPDAGRAALSPSRRSRRTTVSARSCSKRPMTLILHGLEPLHWALAGVGISGVTLALLFIANRRLGISTGFDDICSLALPAPYFKRAAHLGSRLETPTACGPRPRRVSLRLPRRRVGANLGTRHVRFADWIWTCR